VKFSEALGARAAEVEAGLERAIAELPPGTVTEAMGYALAGGKRLRGFLVMESAALHGVVAGLAVPAAAAIEALHAYSLVHDDLPAMDDDDMRRGRPTVHVKWDEATAVLVGDALQSLAFELLASGDLGADRKLAMSASLARAAGARGMVRGQALDIEAERAEKPLTLDEIVELQAGKTGALIEWSCVAGPLMAGADTKAMSAYARALGLAFQITDDILDVTGDEAKTGKRLKKDARAGKATFVSLLGLEGAKARARALVGEAEAALDGYGGQAETLRAAARFVISREF
jgi:farnesyl diphosphate synthase